MDSIIFLFILCLFCYDIITDILSKDKSQIWKPSTFLIVYLSYYVLIPYITRSANASEDGQFLLLLGSLLFYIIFKIAFKVTSPQINFIRFNNILTHENTIKSAIILFFIGFVGYGMFNGFSLSIFTNSSKYDSVFNEDASYNHTEMYITYLVSLFTFCCAVVYAIKQKISLYFIIMILLSMIIYIIGGFRYRILMLFVTVFTVIYLFPKPHNIRYVIIIPLFISMYILMGIMESARMYGKGLDASIISEIKRTGEIKDVSENIMVYEFSSECMAKYKPHDYILFEPIVNAIFMPIPRSLFPWKPKGTYMRDANIKIYGTITRGNAFLNITEAYISFGWIGIMLYAWFLGWLSKLFWNNYVKNKDSLGAIVLLGLYNATLYQIIARGYMAQALTTFVYYIFMPFWILLILKKIKVIK